MGLVSILTHVLALVILLAMLPVTLLSDIADGVLHLCGCSRQRRRWVTTSVRYLALSFYMFRATLICHPSLILCIGWARVAFSELNSSNIILTCTGPDSLVGDFKLVLCLQSFAIIRCCRFVTRAFECLLICFPLSVLGLAIYLWLFYLKQ